MLLAMMFFQEATAVPMLVVGWPGVVLGVLTLLIPQVATYLQGRAADRKRAAEAVLASEAEEKKDALLKTQLENQKKALDEVAEKAVHAGNVIAEIKETGDKNHKLLNGPLGIVLMKLAVSDERLAALPDATQEDKDAAIISRNASNEHTAAIYNAGEAVGDNSKKPE